MHQNKATISKQILKDIDPASISPLPIAIKRARGIKLYDYDGNKYFDFYLDQGSSFLGYQNKHISPILKNILNYGFYNAYPSHLKKRAQGETLKSLEFITNKDFSNHESYFFNSYLTLQQALNSLSSEIPSLENLSFNSPLPSVLKIKEDSSFKGLYINNSLYSFKKESLDINDYNFIIIGSILFNGCPVNTLLINKKNLTSNSTVIDDSLVPIFYQTLLSTLKELKKMDLHEKKLLTLLAPYKNKIVYYGNGFFGLKNLTDVNYPSLVLQLEKKGLLVSPYQPIFSLSTQTDSHQLAYFLKSIKDLT